jgi:hypothetical protein
MKRNKNAFFKIKSIVLSPFFFSTMLDLKAVKIQLAVEKHMCI